MADYLKRVGLDFGISVLRVLVINALVHRTYLGAHVQMRVYDHKLSIWNEGGLPFGLTLEELKGEHNSRPCNLKMANVCFMAGYIKAWVRGTLKIINACKESGLQEPLIPEINGSIAITLYKKTNRVNLEDILIRKRFGRNSEPFTN